MSSLMSPRTVGEWQKCKLKNCNKVFFRHAFGHRCYGISDKSGVCPLCIFNKKVENGTLSKKYANISKFVQHKGIDAKPESNSL